MHSTDGLVDPGHEMALKKSEGSATLEGLASETEDQVEGFHYLTGWRFLVVAIV